MIYVQDLIRVDFAHGCCSHHDESLGAPIQVAIVVGETSSRCERLILDTQILIGCANAGVAVRGAMPLTGDDAEGGPRGD